eukprot:m.341310 g.341310  ORF g.341310 m.341310 type:complete len:104 (+) comp19999_c0_seq1:182-493(+)
MSSDSDSSSDGELPEGVSFFGTEAGKIIESQISEDEEEVEEREAKRNKVEEEAAPKHNLPKASDLLNEGKRPDFLMAGANIYHQEETVTFDNRKPEEKKKTVA